MGYVADYYRTWQGDRGEQWSPAQGLESVLLSIQSLLSANPYTLEPGFENSHSENDTENMEIYKSKVIPLYQRINGFLKRVQNEPKETVKADIVILDPTRESATGGHRTA
jgi:hypothetical protein